MFEGDEERKNNNGGGGKRGRGDKNTAKRPRRGAPLVTRRQGVSQCKKKSRGGDTSW